MGSAPLQLASIDAFTEEDTLPPLSCCSWATIERYRSSRKETSCSGWLLSEPASASRLKTILLVTGLEQIAKLTFQSKRTDPVSQGDHECAPVSHKGITGTTGASLPAPTSSRESYLVI